MTKMETATLFADWDPRPDFKLGMKDTDKKLTYLGSKVWRNPHVEIVEKEVPQIGPEDVLIEVQVCGICGSDVHMAQADEDGYIFYPGLTAFPCTLGHEFSGRVVEAGELAFNKRTSKRFVAGDAVCAEEMIWCSTCKPCADGYPNHCERLQEIGFSIDGAYAKFIKIHSRYCWSLDPLFEKYNEKDAFLLGSLVEPTSVAYNAVIERGGGIRPGDNVAIFGGGPIGLAAIAILKRAGAAKILLSEPSPVRRAMAKDMGTDILIDPMKESSVSEKILDETSGMGAKLYLEATGRPEIVYKDIEDTIWNGKQLNSTVVVVARADAKIPVTGEVLQVRRASIVGSQGHSGHGTFPKVIESMAAGMDMRPLCTKQIRIKDVPENLKLLQTELNECKISVFPSR